MKKICLFLTCLSVIVLISIMPFDQVNATTNGPKVQVNSEYIQFTEDLGFPFINSEGRTMLPLRAFSDCLEAEIGWDNETKTAFCEKNGNKVEFIIGEKEYRINGLVYEMDTEAVLIKGRTYIPFRYAAESLGCTVLWEQKSNTIKIDESNISYYEDRTVPYNGRLIYCYPKTGYNYAYIIYIPNSTSEKKGAINLIVDCVNTGYLESNNDNLYQTAINSLGWQDYIATETNSVLMMALFERPENDPYNYTHALDSDSIKKTNLPTSEIHKQFHNMIIDCKNHLYEEGILVEEKVITCGFSASGQFAHRYALLYPEDVNIVVAGGLGGQITIPAKNYNEITIAYPIGIAGIKNFDIEEYGKIRQFIYQGESDDNRVIIYNDAFMQSERECLEKAMGINIDNTNNLELLDKTYTAATESGSNIDLRIMKNEGHEISMASLRNIVEFINKNK